MRVLLFASSFLPLIGGRELVLHHLAAALQALGHEPRVLSLGGWWRYRGLRFGYPVERLPCLVRANWAGGEWGGWLREMQLQLGLEGVLRRWRPDIVHAHTTYPPGYLALRALEGSGVPLVMTPHGADIHTIPSMRHGLRLDGRLEGRIRAAVQGADALTAISRSIERALLDAGADPGRVHRIANGVEVERFAAPPEVDVRGRFGLPPDARIILSVGNYHPRKGHEVAVRAMTRVVRELPTAHLVIAGRDDERLRRAILAQGMEGRVTLAGLVRREAGEPDWLAALYGAAEVYVSAGVDEGAEGLSLAVLEAMAAKLPVVASRISGNCDVVREGENGRLFLPGDAESLAGALLELLSDPAARDTMAGAAVTFAREHDWAAVARRYLALYESLCARRGRDE